MKEWLQYFLREKFKLQRIPPFSWPFLLPLIVLYWIYTVFLNCYNFIRWFIGFEKCDTCKRFKWSHVEMLLYGDFFSVKSGEKYRNIENKMCKSEKDAWVHGVKYKCFSCDVADKLTAN